MTPDLSARPESADDPRIEACADDLLELLGDEYARRVLEAVTPGPRTAQEVVEAVDVSTPTAYRRLDRLERAGLVEATTVPNADGHHCTRYWAVVEDVHVEVTEDGLCAVIDTAGERDREF